MERGGCLKHKDLCSTSLSGERRKIACVPDVKQLPLVLDDETREDFRSKKVLLAGEELIPKSQAFRMSSKPQARPSFCHRPIPTLPSTFREGLIDRNFSARTAFSASGIEGKPADWTKKKWEDKRGFSIASGEPSSGRIDYPQVGRR